MKYSSPHVNLYTTHIALRAIYYSWFPTSRVHDFTTSFIMVSYGNTFLARSKSSIIILMGMIFASPVRALCYVHKNANSTLLYSIPWYYNFECNLQLMHHSKTVLCSFLQGRKDSLLQQPRSWFISFITDGNSKILRFEWILVIFYLSFLLFR